MRVNTRDGSEGNNWVREGGLKWVVCGGVYLSDELRHDGDGSLPSRAQGLLGRGGSESMRFVAGIAVKQ